MENRNVFEKDFLLTELLDRTDEVVFFYNLTAAKFLYLNAAFEEVWEITRENLYADPSVLLRSIHPEDQTHALNALLEIKNGQQKQNVEFRIQLQNEKVRWIKMSAFLTEKKAAKIISGIAVDTTEEKDYNDTLHKFAAKKNSILEILAHDLTGPLNNIKIASVLLEQEFENNVNEKVKDLLDMIRRNCGNGINLIRDFVKQEFLESSQASLVKQRTDLIKKVREVVEQYKNSEDQLAKTFNLFTCCNSLFINIDDSKFMQVVNNLISNAIKFTPDKGIISVYIEEKDDTVLLKVEDNGIGIPKRLQPVLFDKFTAARRPGIKGQPSVGLGMSIIKTIVEWHGGKIWFESMEGKGSTFYIEIPKE
jgi:two-component system sensor histidine kinase VicK